MRRDKCVGEGRKPSDKRLTADEAAYLDDTLREPMQPSSDRSRSPSRLGSSGGDHPAVDGLPNLDASILRAVRGLGRHPVEMNDPKTEEAKAETRLALRIRRSRDKLLPQTRAWLEGLRAEPASRKQLASTGPRAQSSELAGSSGASASAPVHRADDQPPPLDADIMRDVRILGRLPKELKYPKTDGR